MKQQAIDQFAFQIEKCLQLKHEFPFQSAFPLQKLLVLLYSLNPPAAPKPALHYESHPSSPSLNQITHNPILSNSSNPTTQFVKFKKPTTQFVKFHEFHNPIRKIRENHNPLLQNSRKSQPTFAKFKNLETQFEKFQKPTTQFCKIRETQKPNAKKKNIELK